MVAATFSQNSFIGGEVSKSVQGQFDNKRYRTWMNVCLNGQSMEQEAWTRRPGFRHIGMTRGGLPGRVISFDFKQSSPYTMEFTSGYLRFRAGPDLVLDNQVRAVVSISSATPAKVATTVPHQLSSNNAVAFSSLGANNPLLQNRLFTITVTSTTEFTIADGVTGAAIDGSTLGAFVSGNVYRVLEYVTPYVGTTWSTLRSIQADIPTTNSTTPGAVLLHGAIPPYVLQVVTPPIPGQFATFSLAVARFKDGPYFDPVPGGTLATPSALIGNINLTLSFNAYDAARSYAIGDYVASGGINYKSLVDANLGSAPPSANWVAVNAADAVGPNGFVGTDIGRMVRLYSEPPLWLVGTAYVTGNVVAYAGTYWKALANSTGATPNTDTTKWALFSTGAIWTWGKILSLSNVIDRALAGSASLGDMTSGGGLSAAFDGVLSQVAASSAEKLGVGVSTFTGYVGKNYSGASNQKIAQAIVYPSSDRGIASEAASGSGPDPSTITITLNLRGNAILPASAADGTLLGSTGSISNTSSPITIVSGDQTTAWKYVWVEAIIVWTSSFTAGAIAVAELAFVSPAGTGSSAGVNVQILGDPLLYTSAIRIWRLGLYSDTTGWPTCGTYHEGRLWLSGVIANRIDGSRSNEIFNFAPTNPDGTVPANAGISYTFNAPDVNPIFWMSPDYQGIVCGTQAGEWLVQATSQNLPLTPTTIQAHRYTKYNCANVLPAKTNLTLAVVQAFKRELLEYFAEVYSGKFMAHDLVEHSKHLVAAGIQEVAYQQELIPTLWWRDGNGLLRGMTYSRTSLQSSEPPEVCAPHRVVLGSGLAVESICMGANADGTLDALTIVLNEPNVGRRVEMITNTFLETDDPAQTWFLDSAVMPSSTVSTSTPSGGAPYGGLTINGLWHLNGKTVAVMAGALDCGNPGEGNPIVDFLVTNGSVFVPYGDSVSAGSGGGQFTAAFAATNPQIVVGFPYTSDGQIVRPNAPAESGSRNGPAFGKLRRNEYFMLLVNQTAGLSIGTRFDKMDPVLFKADAGPALAIGATFSGVYRDNVQDDDTYEGALCWRVTRPLPVTICAIGGGLHTKDV